MPAYHIEDTYLRFMTTKVHCTLFILMSLSFSSFAQEEYQEEIQAHFKDWYHVEIYIFENKKPIPNRDPESWPKNIALAYPPNLQFLTDPNAPVETPAPIAENITTESIPEEFEPTPTPSATPEATLSSSHFILDLETPFVLLDSAEQTLKLEVADIERHGDYRTLFHQAWRQPVTDKKEAKNIVVIAGDAFQNNNELEGTINISLSRYLHISTNLWFSHYEPNFGQTSQHWPPLPAQPEKPKAIEPSFFSNESNLDEENLNFDFDRENGDLQKWNIEHTSDSELFSINSGNIELDSNKFGNTTNSAFITTQIVKIETKRRMRSGELHFIDHPQVGILIKIDKYEPEILEALDTIE